MFPRVDPQPLRGGVLKPLARLQKGVVPAVRREVLFPPGGELVPAALERAQFQFAQVFEPGENALPVFGFPVKVRAERPAAQLFDPPVQFRETRRPDLFLPFEGHVLLRPGAKLGRADVPRGLSHEGLYDVAGKNNVFPVFVFPVNQQMRVGMGGVVMVRRLPVKFVSGLQFQFFDKPFRQGGQVSLVRLGAQEDTEVLFRHIAPVLVNVRTVKDGLLPVPVGSLADQILFKLDAVGFEAAGILGLHHAFLAGVNFFRAA